MTRQLDAGICHDPFASLCHFPLSKFNIVLQKIRSHESWATRQLSWDPGHFGTSKQCRWFALVQASGEKWSSRNRNFWNLQKNWGPICIPWSVIPAIVFFLWKFAKPLLPAVPLGSLGRSVAVFSSWYIPYLLSKSGGVSPEAMFDPKNCSLIHKWNQKRNDSLIYFEACHPNGEKAMVPGEF